MTHNHVGLSEQLKIKLIKIDPSSEKHVKDSQSDYRTEKQETLSDYENPAEPLVTMDKLMLNRTIRAGAT